MKDSGCAGLQHALCSVGLLPFFVNSLRQPAIECKAAALRLVALTLSAQIKPAHIEVTHLMISSQEQSSPAPAEMNTDSIKAQLFISQAFAALPDMLVVSGTFGLLLFFLYAWHTCSAVTGLAEHQMSCAHPQLIKHSFTVAYLAASRM